MNEVQQEVMGTTTFVPVRMWPLDETASERVDGQLRDELVRVGCDGETVEYESWERTSIEIDGELMDGYARLATGVKA